MPHKFFSIFPMHIQLTVTWNQDSASNVTHDASSSWSEDVTSSGFKACVLVAGRHFTYNFDKKPSVFWMAYQRGVTQLGYRAVEVGVVNMTVWYTGSRCQFIYPLRVSMYIRMD